MLKINEILIENMEKGVVTDNYQPAISFSLSSELSDVRVSSYQIIVSRHDSIVWNSGTRNSDRILNIRYEGEKLLPFLSYKVKIKVEDTYGQAAEKQTFFETGRLDTRWKAQWITDKFFHFLFLSPKPMIFRKFFQIDGEIESARIYSTAFGVYDIDLNGERVNDIYFAPGFTNYKSQLQYQTYDVTKHCKKSNSIYVVVAGGWAVGDFSMMHTNKIYENKQALLLEIRITYKDGRIIIIGTDNSWEVSERCAWRYADFYNGEIFDARVDNEHIKYRKAAIAIPKCRPEIVASYGSPVRMQEHMKPVRHWMSKSGGIIYDFGQNFAGIIHAEIDGVAGQKIKFRHAEICRDNELYTRPLRWAKARLIYICRSGKQIYSPRFTYMGFRYVEVKGVGEKDIKLEAYALYSDLEPTGKFECSDKNLNRLQQNIIWSSKSNFIDIPTDCPQRDERMGWTGDIAVFAGTACFNFRMKRFLDKWLLDLISEQDEKGGFPDVIPRGKYGKPRTTDCWADSCILVPWASYMAYGDVELLKRQYDSMKRHINAELVLARKDSSDSDPEQYIWRAGYHWGDWLSPGETKKQWREKTPWIATAYMANSCKLLSLIAAELGNHTDYETYKYLGEEISSAYLAIHADPYGKLKKEFQSGYVLPLYFGMVKDSKSDVMADRLASLVDENANHLSTGFCGTPYILFALSDNGHLDKAYELLLQDTCPSWLYEVKIGGTTIWERWDALRPDGTVNLSNNMVSFNHYAYGAVGDWLYRRVGGIEMLQPAYREFRIKPMPGGGLTWAKSSIKTSYGEILSSWRISEEFFIHIKVPVNTICHLVMPDGEQKKLGSGDYNFSCCFGGENENGF